MQTSRVDRIITKIKNNPFLSLVITAGIIIISVGAATVELKNLVKTLHEIVTYVQDKLESNVDISGKWIAQESVNGEMLQTYFDFQVVNGKLFGKVWFSPTFEMQYGGSNITDGKVRGKHIKFTTKHKYVSDLGLMNSETGRRDPDVWMDIVTHYDGTLKKNLLILKTETEHGYYRELTVKKIIDKTEVFIDRRRTETHDAYQPLYVFPEPRQGGVKSLSFGPNEVRFLSGGLILAVGGAEDGKVEFWDVGMAELHSEFDIAPATQGGAFAYSTFDPNARGGAASFRTVGVWNDRHNARLGTFSINPTSPWIGGGYQTYDFPGSIKQATISRDSTKVAILIRQKATQYNLEIHNDKRFSYRYSGEGVVGAVSLSSDGSFVALAESTGPTETSLTLRETVTGNIIWKRISERPIQQLDISFDNNLIASAHADYSSIEIWDAKSGSWKLNLPLEKAHGVSFLAFANRSNSLAVASVPAGVITLWDVESGSLSLRLEYDELVGALAFSQDDRLLAAGSTDTGIIKLWGKPKNEQPKLP